MRLVVVVGLAACGPKPVFDAFPKRPLAEQVGSWIATTEDGLAKLDIRADQTFSEALHVGTDHECKRSGSVEHLGNSLSFKYVDTTCPPRSDHEPDSDFVSLTVISVDEFEYADRYGTTFHFERRGNVAQAIEQEAAAAANPPPAVPAPEPLAEPVSMGWATHPKPAEPTAAPPVVTRSDRSAEVQAYGDGLVKALLGRGGAFEGGFQIPTPRVRRTNHWTDRPQLNIDTKYAFIILGTISAAHPRGTLSMHGDTYDMARDPDAAIKASAKEAGLYALTGFATTGHNLVEGGVDVEYNADNDEPSILIVIQYYRD